MEIGKIKLKVDMENLFTLTNAGIFSRDECLQLLNEYRQKYGLRKFTPEEYEQKFVSKNPPVQPQPQQGTPVGEYHQVPVNVKKGEQQVVKQMKKK